MGTPKIHTAGSIEIWNAGIAAVDAKRITANTVKLTSRQLRIADQCFELDSLEAVTVIGFGKCSGLMAQGIEAALRPLPKRIALRGLVIVPQGQVATTENIECVVGRENASNFPTDVVVQQTRRMMRMIEGSGPHELVIALVSGGGSALLEDPRVPLEDLVALSKSISGQGASIQSLNTVRRALSGVKAGGLAAHVLKKSSATLVALVISDVIGDDMAMVASGPTVLAGGSVGERFRAAQHVLRGLPEVAVPDSVKTLLGRCENEFATTSNPTVDAANDPSNGRISNHLLANNATAVNAAKKQAAADGYRVVETNLDVCRDVVEVADDWVRQAQRLKNDRAGGPLAIVAGGEPTVKLCPSPGRGGRNLQLAALVMQGLMDCDWPMEIDIAFAAGGSDGEDGTAPVSGGCFDGGALRRLAAAKSEHTNARSGPTLATLRRSIAQNDCFGFFETVGQYVPPPPVSTNICDLQVMLIG